MKLFNANFNLKHFLISLFLTGATMSTYAEPKSTGDFKSEKTAIVLVAFGSTATQTVQTFEKIEQSFKKAFPEYPVSWAFTSDIVVKKLRESGKQISNVEESVKELTQKGYSSIVLQSLHIMPGEEFHSIPTTDSSAKIIIGRPLLATDKDIEAVAKILIPLCKSDTPTVIAAHGNSKYPEYNKPLHTIATLIEKQCPNSVLCTVEGAPGTEPMKKVSASAKKLNSVNFIPFMLIAGVHVKEDLNGQDTSSWKNLLGVSNANILDPMGNLSAVHELFITHCKDALTQVGK